MNRYLALFLLVIIIECSPESKESSSEQTSIISPSQPATPVSSNNTNSTSNGTELVSPNLNEGSINFEEAILSFFLYFVMVLLARLKPLLFNSINSSYHLIIFLYNFLFSIDLLFITSSSDSTSSFSLPKHFHHPTDLL